MSSTKSLWSEDTSSHVAVSIHSNNVGSFNKISRHFLPLLTVLRFFGPYPILFKTKNPLLFLCKKQKTKDIEPENNKFLYEFGWRKWKSPIIIYSYALTFINILVYTVFIFNKGFALPFPLEIFEAPEGLNKSVKEIGINSVTHRISMVAEGFIKLVELIIIFFNSGSFVSWVNNWNIFERDFSIYFTPKNVVLEINMKKFKVLVLIFYCLIPAVFWISLETFVMRPGPGQNFAEVLIFTLWVNILLMGHTLLEDYKTLLMLKTLQGAFQQIRRAMTLEFKRHLVISTDVIAWRQLIHQIRCQVLLCSENLKCRQLILLMESVLIFSFGILLAADITAQNQTIVDQHCFLVSVISFSVISFFRLYSITLMAENIYQEERLLSTDIVEMQMNYLDTLTKMELKFIYTMIAQTPSVITLGNYIKVNKKMLLRVAVQVLTFLIALMQFNNSLRHEGHDC